MMCSEELDLAHLLLPPPACLGKTEVVEIMIKPA
jgi:hypothetical protein